MTKRRDMSKVFYGRNQEWEFNRLIGEQMPKCIMVTTVNDVRINY
jgi:hypothetical protein